jgi:hypothetical protein
MDTIKLGFKFTTKRNENTFIISDIWKRKLLDINSPLQVTICDDNGSTIISMCVDEATHEIQRGRWKPM